MRANKIPVEKVVIRTELSKTVEGYSTVSPHVAAAKRMEKDGKKVSGGTIVSYVVTKGKGKIRDKVKLPHEVKQKDYDGEYYIDHQILPGVERIFDVLDVHIDELTKNTKQKTLEHF